MMRRYHIAVAAVALFLSVCAQAVPARPGVFGVRQSDGSVVRVQMLGDEHRHVTVTEDGCAVCMAADGFFHYLERRGGTLHDTGLRLGVPVSADVVLSARAAAREHLEAASASGAKPSGSMPLAARNYAGTRAHAKERIIVLLVQFPDLRFTYPRSRFVDMLSREGYSADGATGSALEYFAAQFGDKCEFEVVVSNVLTVPKGFAYYGGNSAEDDSIVDIKAPELVRDACRLADQEVDFSSFAVDGKVENLFLFVAGPCESDPSGMPDNIWPHRWSLRQGTGSPLVLDGVKLDVYAMSTELCYDYDTGRNRFTPIGTFCHEFSHMLGLPDLYDSDYEKSGGRSAGVFGSLSLMDDGCYANDGNTPPFYNAFELDLLGLGECRRLTPGEWTLPALSASQKVYLRAETDTEGEYYLFECRNSESWDRFIGGSSHTPGTGGLVVYHVDLSDRDSGYSDLQKRNLKASERYTYNELNCRPDHMCVKVIPALANAQDVQQVFFPQKGVDFLDGSAWNRYWYWSGNPSMLKLTDITRPTVKEVDFVCSGPLEVLEPDVYQDGVIVGLRSDAVGLWNSKALVRYTYGDKVCEAEVLPYSPGRWTVIARGLEPGTQYAFEISVGDVSKTVKFSTRPLVNGGFPSIALPGDGSGFKVGSKLPLMVLNAPGSEVRWYFGSREVFRAGDGYYSPSSPGELRAVISLPDGTEEVVVKEVLQ